MKHPLVTVQRSAWRDLIAQACGHRREGGGLLIGRHTRYGNHVVERVLAMAHTEATKDHVTYDDNEIVAARVAAYEAYKPWEIIGEWHVHPHATCCAKALEPQITDNWKEPATDVNSMGDGDIEIILSVFGWPGYWLKPSDMRTQASLGNVLCYAEPWLRVRYGKVVPCRIRVR